jgi:hypothetical protein
LETREYNAAKRAYLEHGWRVVVEQKGRELLCAQCLGRLDPKYRAALTKRGAQLNPSVTLTRPRYRPGLFPCAHCDGMVRFDQACVRMGKTEHVRNLYCDPCAIADARRRGYDAIVPGSQPKPKTRRKGAQQALPMR